MRRSFGSFSLGIIFLIAISIFLALLVIVLVTYVLCRYFKEERQKKMANQKRSRTNSLTSRFLFWIFTFSSLISAGKFRIAKDFENFRIFLESQKAVKKDRHKEAELLQKQAWLRQLQILEHEQLKQLPDPVVFELLNDPVNALNYIELKHETARLISIRSQIRRSDPTIRSIREMRDTREVMAYIRSIADDLEQTETEMSEKMAFDKLIDNIGGCRLEKIQIRRDTAVQLSMNNDPQVGDKKLFKCPRERTPRELHMNRMRDYYGKTLILCQAPLPHQFADQWQAIWDEKVIIDLSL